MGGLSARLRHSMPPIGYVKKGIWFICRRHVATQLPGSRLGVPFFSFPTLAPEYGREKEYDTIREWDRPLPVGDAEALQRDRAGGVSPIVPNRWNCSQLSIPAVPELSQ